MIIQIIGYSTALIIKEKSNKTDINKVTNVGVPFPSVDPKDHAKVKPSFPACSEVLFYDDWLFRESKPHQKIQP